MLITKEVEVKWGNNRKIYEPLGYKFTKRHDLFMVKIEDLADGSHVEVDILCDYCGQPYKKRYEKYHRHRKESVIQKDACDKCKHLKADEGNYEKYGRKKQYQKYSDTEIVKQEFLDLGLTPLFDEYTSPSIKLPFTCDKHFGKGIQYSTYNKFKHHNQGCKYCGYERASGELHHNYNPELTDAEREFGRNIIYSESGLSQWQFRDAVIKRDNFTCQCCGEVHSSGKTIAKRKLGFRVHHLNGYHWFKEGQADVNNATTLCESCHKLFHKIYGNKYNTKLQFQEFKLRYESGEFTEILQSSQTQTA